MTKPSGAFSALSPRVQHTPLMPPLQAEPSRLRGSGVASSPGTAGNHHHVSKHGLGRGEFGGCFSDFCSVIFAGGCSPSIKQLADRGTPPRGQEFYCCSGFPSKAGIHWRRGKDWTPLPEESVEEQRCSPLLSQSKRTLMHPHRNEFSAQMLLQGLSDALTDRDGKRK